MDDDDDDDDEKQVSRREVEPYSCRHSQIIESIDHIVMIFAQFVIPQLTTSKILKVPL